MTAISCPHCRSPMNLSVKFCLSCGRALPSKGLFQFTGLKSLLRDGVTKRLDEAPSTGTFDRSRRSYRLQQMLRQISISAAYVVVFLVLYALAVFYAVKDPKLAAIIQSSLKQHNHTVSQAATQNNKSLGKRKNTD